MKAETLGRPTVAVKTKAGVKAGTLWKLMAGVKDETLRMLMPKAETLWSPKAETPQAAGSEDEG